MKHWLRRIIGISFIAYILWLIFNVVYGVGLQVSMIWSKDFSFEHFERAAYVYVGSWITYLFFFISCFKCARVCVSYENSAKNLIISGLFGIIGYLVPMFTYSIYVGNLQLPSLYILFPLYILIIGLIFRRKQTEPILYHAFLSNIIKYKKRN